MLHSEDLQRRPMRYTLGRLRFHAQLHVQCRQHLLQ